MKKREHTLWRTLCVLLGIGFIWCLFVQYFILSNADQEGIDVTGQDRLRRNGKVWTEKSRAEDIMKSIVKLADDLLNIVESSADSSPPPPLKDYKEELQALQIKVEAEKEKDQMKNEMIKELRSDKLYLQQQVVHLEELLKKQAEKGEKKVLQVNSGSGFTSRPTVKADCLQHSQLTSSAQTLIDTEKQVALCMRFFQISFLLLQMSSFFVQEQAIANNLSADSQEETGHFSTDVSSGDFIYTIYTVYMYTADDQIKEDENCPLPPMDGYPDCKGKIKWMKQMWKSDPCYGSYGVNGSLCSILIYLSEIESWCPVLPGRVNSSAEVKNSEVGADHAVVRESLEGLYASLEKRVQFRWIHQRIKSMGEIWLEAGRSLSAKYNLTQRKAKKILVHPGVVTDESGLKIAQTAFSGGPLGELVQWSDLMSTLYILGHNLYFSASIPDLKDFLGIRTGGCPSRHSNVEADLIYTDIIGLIQFQTVLQTSWIRHKCKIRVLDSFGTEPDFNHAAWAQKHKLKSPFGGLNLIPAQFYTMFPHSPDNTFLGFVVQHQLSSEETEQLNSTKRQNQALVYGKSAKFWEGKGAYLDIIHKYLEIHGTVDDSALIPSYVKNHGIIRGTEVQTLLRQSKVFVGLSFPYEGPAPLEALANGCVFLNPRLHPPHSSLNTQFFKGKPNIREVTSQHPYVEAIGEPYVWMVDMYNKTDVERALTAILNQSIEPYLPYEFTCEGMLQRVNILIEKQDFCSTAGSWPPLSSLQVVRAEAGTSCKQACQRAGLICEPAFFPHLNSTKSLANYRVDCQTSEISDSHVVLPAYNKSSKHCLFQSDPLLFSCVRSSQSLIRICPCRDYIKDQIALCKACI